MSLCCGYVRSTAPCLVPLSFAVALHYLAISWARTQLSDSGEGAGSVLQLGWQRRKSRYTRRAGPDGHVALHNLAKLEGESEGQKWLLLLHVQHKTYVLAISILFYLFYIRFFPCYFPPSFSFPSFFVVLPRASLLSFLLSVSGALILQSCLWLCSRKHDVVSPTLYTVDT